MLISPVVGENSILVYILPSLSTSFTPPSFILHLLTPYLLHSPPPPLSLSTSFTPHSPPPSLPTSPLLHSSHHPSFPYHPFPFFHLSTHFPQVLNVLTSSNTGSHVSLGPIASIRPISSPAEFTLTYRLYPDFNAILFSDTRTIVNTSAGSGSLPDQENKKCR